MVWAVKRKVAVDMILECAYYRNTKYLQIIFILNTMVSKYNLAPLHKSSNGLADGKIRLRAKINFLILKNF